METSLHAAVRSGRLSDVLMSLACPDVDVNARNADGATALFLSLVCEFSDAARVILEHPDINVDILDARGVSCFHFVVSKDLDLFDAMLRKTDVNVKTKRGFTNLHLAIRYQRVTIVERLLQCDNIDVNATTYNGHTPLILACLYKGEHGRIRVRDVKIAKLLIADPRTDLWSRWLRGGTCGRSVMALLDMVYNDGDDDANPSVIRKLLVRRMRCDVMLTLVALSSIRQGNALSRFPIELLRMLMCFL